MTGAFSGSVSLMVRGGRIHGDMTLTGTCFAIEVQSIIVTHWPEFFKNSRSIFLADICTASKLAFTAILLRFY